jgi:hypothetical protein
MPEEKRSSCTGNCRRSQGVLMLALERAWRRTFLS